MSKFSDSDRWRTVVLNVPLFALFACAWVSDRWPELMVPALSVAAGVTIAEVAALALMAQRRTAKSRSAVADSPAHVSAPLDEMDTPVEGLARASDVAFLSGMAAKYTDLGVGVPRVVIVSHSMGVYVAGKHAHVVRRRQIVRSHIHGHATVELAVQRPASQLPTLPDWKVVPQGQEAFTIDAGAFEIEHFGGRTNIRIHDPDRVTVEGSKRGSPLIGAPAEIKAPQYN